MQHVCNPWCFDGYHALLFDATTTDLAQAQAIGTALAARNGLTFVSVTTVRQQPGTQPGRPGEAGIGRTRAVVFAR